MDSSTDEKRICRLRDNVQECSQDWSGGGGPQVANVSDGGPTVHQISMLSCYCWGGGGCGQPKTPLNTPLMLSGVCYTCKMSFPVM